MWGRGQVSQSTLGQGSRLAFYFKYDGTLLKGSKVTIRFIVINIIPATEWRLNLRNKGGKNTEKTCQKQTPQESWRGDDCVLLTTAVAKT